MRKSIQDRSERTGSDRGAEPLFLAGKWIATDQTRTIVSPYDGTIVGKVTEADPVLVDQAVVIAAKVLETEFPAYQRSDILQRAASLLASDRETFARTIALEAGKPIRAARVEADRAVFTLRAAASAAVSLAGEQVPMDTSPAGDRKIAFTLREPVGVVGAITPFNFPLNLVAHKLAPAIAAGCPTILKPAARTSMSALHFAHLLREAELPDGMLSVLPGDGATVGQALVEHPGVDLLTFTGSSDVGYRIRAAAPKKKVLLELGGSAPLLVFADADLEAAATACSLHGFSYAGQSCISVQRVILHESVFDEFVSLVVPKVERLVTGDPMDERTDVGPLIHIAERDRIFGWIEEAANRGARILTGNRSRGSLLFPTVLTDVPEDAAVNCREVFGPVVTLSRFRDPDDAIRQANATPFGLQAGVYTSSINTALHAARCLRFGAVLINEAPTFRADPMPYGGVKESGNTREGPLYAAREMTETRLIVLPSFR